MQTYTQVENGLTYTSPSLYVIYSYLRATERRSDSALHTIGPSFAEKTIGYSSRFLAYGTLSMPDAGCSEHVVVDGFHTIDFSSLYYNPITTTTTYKAGCAPYVNPRLSLPADLTSIDPTWQSCEPLFYGAFDPPSVITKASGGLVPSPVGAGQVTDPVLAQPTLNSGPAQPVVTPSPPVPAPTNGAASSNPPPPQNLAANPNNPPAPSADNGPGSAANTNGASTPVASKGDTQSSQPPAKPKSEAPSDEGQIESAPDLAGNPDQPQSQTPSPIQGALPGQPSETLGSIINSAFAPNDPIANPASGGTPAAAEASKPATSSGLVAVPIDTGDGKPAYAIVSAEPAAPGGYGAPVAKLPLTGSLSQQHSPSSNGQSAEEGLNPTSGGANNGNDATSEGGSSPVEDGNEAGAGSGNDADGTTKVMLNDGSIANIPTADIVKPTQPQGNLDDPKGPPAGFQTIHLSAGAFVAVHGAARSLSSVAVQGGDYLLPTTFAATPQQTLKLQSGQLTVVPLDTSSQHITLQGGQVTAVPLDAPPQAVTLQNGKISTISPNPATTLTLADGQITPIPVSIAVAGAENDNLDLPQQILTLANGETTTVPINLPAQTLTLQDGKVATISPDSPPQTLTLANGLVSTISPIPHTAVTLANGKVTSIPTGADAFAGNETADFISIPDATISGKVYYTHLPVVQLQNAESNSSVNGSATNGTAAGNSTGISTSVLGTANLVSPAAVSTTLPTPSGSITKFAATATIEKTSRGLRSLVHPVWGMGVVTLALACWIEIL